MINIFQPVSFSNISGWYHDDHHAAFNAFLHTARYHVGENPYQQKSLAIGQIGFRTACLAAIELSKNGNSTPTDAKEFFERYFTPHQVKEQGLITGYYEPDVDVRFQKDVRYKYPIYKRPDDLIDIEDPDNPPDGIQNGFAFARQTPDGMTLYPTRKEIDQGYLEGFGLEIAYAKSKADVYFTHIQGSARLKDKDGLAKRITYAAKSGHPYTSIGKILIERGQISDQKMSMDAIRNWMNDNPEQVDELLWCNKSFIFFDELPDSNPNLGPVGAAKVQLSNERSLAIDRSIYQFGLPIFVSSREAGVLSSDKCFEQLMIAQDTGSAILGPARGDIFIGSGLKAGQTAGSIAHKATYYVLLPSAQI